LQPLYNLARREAFERELEPLCEDMGLGVITYSSLARGFFSGKYRPGDSLPSTARAGGVQANYMNERGFRALEAARSVAAEHNATPAQVALAWNLSRPSITAPIASATTPEQARELVGAADVRLDAEGLTMLEQASSWR
jgi:aryl-alcohol dehydrogenase-like predicted oxidoreductase